MSTSLMSLLLMAPLVGYPAPRDKGGLPPEIVDLLPENTAAVLLVDVQRVAKSPFGKRLVKLLADDMGNNNFVTPTDVADDVEYAVIGQFDIANFAGDFCMIFRLREKSNLPFKLMEHVSKNEDGSYASRVLGRHTIYLTNDANTCIAILDPRTVALVIFSPNQNLPDEKDKGLESIFGKRANVGPGEAMRKKLKEIPFDHALAVVSEHPKSGTSLLLATWPLGLPNPHNGTFKDQVMSYRGGVRVGETADAIFEIVATSRDAAKKIADTLHDSLTGTANTMWNETVRKSVNVKCDQDRVTLRMSADQSALERALRRE